VNGGGSLGNFVRFDVDCSLNGTVWY